MSNYSLETIYQIWNDEDGTRLEVAPDVDSIDGLTEIRAMDSDGKEETTLLVNRDQLGHLITQLQRRLADIDYPVKIELEKEDTKLLRIKDRIRSAEATHEWGDVQVLNWVLQVLEK